MVQTILNKVFSARFWMALIFSTFFVWGFTQKLINGEAFTVVVLIVVRDYFQRGDRSTNP